MVSSIRRHSVFSEVVPAGRTEAGASVIICYGTLRERDETYIGGTLISICSQCIHTPTLSYLHATKSIQ